MNTSTFVQRNQVGIFVVATVVLTFAIYMLPLPREALPLLMIFIPAFVALILAGITEGRQAVGALLRTLRQPISLRWAVIALAAGVLLRVGVSVAGLLLGSMQRSESGVSSPSVSLIALLPLALISLIAAAAEELGWRGYALPRLLKSQSPLAASLMLGVPWAILHFALLLPGMMSEGMPIVPELVILIALSILTTWVYLGAGNSVIASTLLHGGQNAFVFLNAGIEPARLAWLMMAVYGAAALIVVVANLPAWLSQRSVQEPMLQVE